MVAKSAYVETLAAQKLRAAEIAMRAAAVAMNYVGTEEATMHAKELLGAAKMVQRWELALRRIAAEGADQQEARNP